MTTPRPRSVEPRGLRREDAARFIGVSPSKFDELVKDGRMPAAISVDGCRIWDRYAIDQAFDQLSDAPVSSDWDGAFGDQWRKSA